MPNAVRLRKKSMIFFLNVRHLVTACVSKYESWQTQELGKEASFNNCKLTHKLFYKYKDVVRFRFVHLIRTTCGQRGCILVVY